MVLNHGVFGTLKVAWSDYHCMPVASIVCNGSITIYCHHVACLHHAPHELCPLNILCVCGRLGQKPARPGKHMTLQYTEKGSAAPEPP